MTNLDAIRKRDATIKDDFFDNPRHYTIGSYPEGVQAIRDRRALLAEVDRLTVYIAARDVIGDAEAAWDGGVLNEHARIREAVEGLREELAAMEHEQWAAWATTLMATERISADRKRRWSALLGGYDELSEEMKDHDRVWADRTIAAVLAAIDEETT